MSCNGTDDSDTSTAIDLKAPILEVKCGHLVARLHTEKFVCPGIHQPCIELDGELISPKEFTIRANKDKQKDWKGSIRIGKSNMRALMEMKSLDFYNHENYCSAKCQSRNFMSFKNHLTEAYLNADLLYGGTSSSYEDDKKGIMSLYSQVNDRGNSVVNAIMSTFMKGQKFDEDLTPVEDDTVGSSNSAIMVMKSQPIKFWAGMEEMGLLSDLMDVMMTSMEHLRRLALMGPSQRDAVAERLTRVAGALDLEETIGSRIQAERLNCTVETSLLSNEIQAELQRKTEVSWRRLEESRRKASRIDDLFCEDSSPGVPEKRRRYSTVNSSAYVAASTSGPTSATATATAAIIDENNGLSLVDQ
ncbi:unnamed protein product [Thelazia callipaeda]|uniref:SAND domain-containing protein n=1 Tax=Thelazia callipaeda TaxID=103827 RepID=A0A0N5CWA7_THECL|nr:unnamed protein product [Thelazia callipaeda]